MRLFTTPSRSPWQYDPLGSIPIPLAVSRSPWQYPELVGSIPSHWHPGQQHPHICIITISQDRYYPDDTEIALALLRVRKAWDKGKRM